VSPAGADPVAARVDWYLPGVLGKSRVSTVFGDLPVEALRVRDDLRTHTGISARVELVDKIHLDQDFLRNNPSALPVRIPANAFGPGRPAQDMMLSPGQELCPDAHVVTQFLKARDLQNRFQQDTSQSAGLTYYRFHCGMPAVVRMDGLWIRVRP
jgi:hypothetical protein